MYRRCSRRSTTADTRPSAIFRCRESAWWDDYYRPLEQNLAAFRQRHAGDRDAQELADQVQREIDMWHAYGDFYGYEFFVLRRRDG